MVFTTPAVHALRRRFPSAHLTYIVEPAAAPVVTNNPHIDDVIVAPRRPGIRGLLSDVAFGRRLRAQRPAMSEEIIMASSVTPMPMPTLAN